MKNLSKKRLLFVGAVAFVVIVLVFMSFSNSRNQPGYIEEYVDEDTGAIVSVAPNTTTESVNSEKVVDVLGASSLYTIGSSGLSSRQLPIFTEDLIEKGVTALEGYEDTVKIIDPVYSYEKSQLSASLIYSSKKKPAKIVFEIPTIREFEYRIVADSTVVYSSGLLFVSEDAGDTYTGDGVPPEEQP